MAEQETHYLEKLAAPPLVQDCATPAVADDDDAPEGHVVTCVAEPNEGDTLIWDNGARKWRPQASAATSRPVYIDEGGGSYDPIYDNDGNPIYVSG